MVLVVQLPALVKRTTLPLWNVKLYYIGIFLITFKIISKIDDYTQLFSSFRLNIVYQSFAVHLIFGAS